MWMSSCLLTRCWARRTRQRSASKALGWSGEGSAGALEEAVAGVEFEVGEAVGGVDRALILL